MHAGAQFFHLLDQVGVDLESSGGIEENQVRVGGLGGLEAGCADVGNVSGNAVAVEAEFLLFCEDLELVDGSGAIDVATDYEWAVAAFFE